MTHRLAAFARAFVPLAGLVACVSCSVVPPQEINQEYRDVIERRRTDYLLGPGDTLTVRVFRQEGDLGQQTATVRPDGKIDLFYLHDAEVRGKTVPELQVLLQRAAVRAGLETTPDVTIDVLPKQPQIYLTGQFEKPGPVNLEPGMTVQDAIALGGGVRITADSDYVILRRSYGAELGRSNWYRIDVNDYEEEIILLPGDHIWAERNFAAVIVAYLREFVFGIIPGNVWAAGAAI